MESSSAAKTKNDKAWRNVSEEIKRIFRRSVLQLQEKGTMKPPQAKKFLCSGMKASSSSSSSSMVLYHESQYSILCYSVLWRFLVLLSYTVQPKCVCVCVHSFDLLKYLTGERFS